MNPFLAMLQPPSPEEEECAALIGKLKEASRAAANAQAEQLYEKLKADGLEPGKAILVLSELLKMREKAHRNIKRMIGDDDRHYVALTECLYELIAIRATEVRANGAYLKALAEKQKAATASAKPKK